ncbi:MAG: hypothetical protein KTR20_12285 [Cellvibrionaceae bacterium]|nr:hypothetical protein [Cellvibrionaceae bacterium]
MSEDIVNELTNEEKDAIKSFLISIYGEDQVKSWNINTKVAAIVEQMINKLDGCSKSMDFVPRPGITKPGMKYVLKQIRQMVTRSAKRNIFELKKQYKICIRAIKLNFRTHLSLAAMGL